MLLKIIVDKLLVGQTKRSAMMELQSKIAYNLSVICKQSPLSSTYDNN